MASHYEKMIGDIVDTHQLNSPQELLRWYSQQVINTKLKKEKQRLSTKISNHIETKTIEDFFQQETIIREGLTLEGFTEYLISLDRAYREYHEEIKRNLI
ncbi:MAG: hypothetical protein ABIF18_03010 [archaeon]